MKKLIKKLQDKSKKDPANLSKNELKKYQEEERAKSMKEFDKQQLQEKKDIEIIKKELIKYKDNNKELISLQSTINKRFNVSKTSTNAAKYKTAAVYFNAIKSYGMPKSYYPIDEAAPDFFIPGEYDDMPHYWLMMFQMNTSEDDRGHTIPSIPGNPKEFVIHGFLFPMTSTTIYLGKFKDEKQFGVISHPNDELFHRKWMSTHTETYFETYDKAYNELEKILEKHLSGDEEIFYNQKKNV